MLAVVVAGPAATGRWFETILGQPLLTYFDNASLPAAIVRLTSDNPWGQPVVTVPGGFALGITLGLAGIVATLVLVRRGTIGADHRALFASGSPRRACAPPAPAGRSAVTPPPAGADVHPVLALILLVLAALLLPVAAAGVHRRRPPGRDR